MSTGGAPTTMHTSSVFLVQDVVSWGVRTIHAFERLEQIGEGTFGSVCAVATSLFSPTIAPLFRRVVVRIPAVCNVVC
jgi:hypothetical protein